MNLIPSSFPRKGDYQCSELCLVGPPQYRKSINGGSHGLIENVEALLLSDSLITKFKRTTSL